MPTRRLMFVFFTASMIAAVTLSILAQAPAQAPPAAGQAQGRGGGGGGQGRGGGPQVQIPALNVTFWLWTASCTR
jgi:Spy/CpxP family protein refolding chaperone